MIATGVLSPRSLVVAVGENEWRSVEEAFPETRPPAGPPALPPTLPASAPVSAPPVRAATTPTAGPAGASWFGKLGLFGKLAVAFGAGLLLLIVLAGAAGGPDRQQLQAELDQIDREIYQLQQVAMELKSQVSAGDSQMLKGLIAMGSGMAADNDQQIWTGVENLGSGAIDADHAEMRMKNVVERFQQLMARRNQILSELR